MLLLLLQPDFAHSLSSDATGPFDLSMSARVVTASAATILALVASSAMHSNANIIDTDRSRWYIGFERLRHSIRRLWNARQKLRRFSAST